jgi:hypothetical protein
LLHVWRPDARRRRAVPMRPTRDFRAFHGASLPSSKLKHWCDLIICVLRVFACLRMYDWSVPQWQPVKVLCRAICPITLEVMTDPVCTTDGHVYERSAIEGWFRSADLPVVE